VQLAPESEEARLALGMLLLAARKHAAAATFLKPISEDVHNRRTRAYADALAQTPRGLPRRSRSRSQPRAESQDEGLVSSLPNCCKRKKITCAPCGTGALAEQSPTPTCYGSCHLLSGTWPA